MNHKAVLEFLDGLDEQELTILQTAALLGDRFQLDHLLELNSIKPSTLWKFLAKLAELRIIKKKSGTHNGVYVFAQKKLLNGVLNSLGDEKREVLLQKIIAHLTRELPEDDNKPLILAELYLKFGRKAKRFFQYTKEAANLLASAHRTLQALELYEEIISSLSGEEDEGYLETAVFLNSVTSYAPIATNFRPIETILPILLKARSVAKNVGNVRALAMLELYLGRLHQRQGDSSKASLHYSEGWGLAQDLGDEALLKSASKFSALTMFWQGRMIEAIQVYERTLGDVEAISPDIGSLWANLMLAYCYGLTGRVARGLGMVEALKERAIARGKLKTQGFADAVISLILLEIRQVQKAGSHINNALQVGKEVGDDLLLWMAEPCKAYEIYSKGDLIKAQEMLASAINHAKALGQVHHPSPWIIEILWSFHRHGLSPIAGYSFPSEIRRLISWPDIYMKGAALRYYALDKKMSGADLQEVEELLQESEKLLQEAGTAIELGRTQIELARLLIQRKDSERALSIANKAYATLSRVDHSLFPSELLSMIHDQPKENRIFRGLEAVSRLSSDSHPQPAYKSYLGKVVELFTDMFGAERSAIFLMHKDKLDDCRNIAATRNLSFADLEQLMSSPVRNLMMTAIDKKQAIVIEDAAKNSDLLQQPVNSPPIKSIACIPLLASGSIMGLLYADNRLLEGVFSKSDTLIMAAVATQVALFLRTTALSGKLEELHETFEETLSTSDEAESLEWARHIIGTSKAIKSCLSRAKMVAGTDATVLILGETGVGKELIAQIIHQQSSRASKPFVSVNVSALTENLLTSELFGYERGAFTGAVKTKIGRFETAHQGTVFLDEIGDLSLEGQVKLLRVLQYGEFERVGGTQTVYSDFRLIAATNKNLAQMVATGGFRADLFYRINTFPIEVPPLRERKEDIPLLSHHFLKKYGKKHRKEIKKIPNSEMKKLLAYSWPGNIRELEHLIERALILSQNSALFIPDLKEPCLPVLEEQHAHLTEILPLEEIERRYIIQVLDHVKWRIRGEQGAAQKLGLKPSTLEFRMKKLGIKK